MGYHYPLPDVDTYFMLDCTTAVVAQHPNRSAAVAAAGLPRQLDGGGAAAVVVGGPKQVLTGQQQAALLSAPGIPSDSMHLRTASGSSSGSRAVGAWVSPGSASSSSSEAALRHKQ